jgi:drug/metabolite transporter (DMT)-like permease
VRDHGDPALSAVLGVLGALVAAVSYGVASVLQAVAARRTSGSTSLDPRLLIRLGSQWSYLAGIGLDLIGFLASLAALRTLPLFFVQSAIAGSVGVTVIIAVAVLGARLTRREAGALAALGAGLVLLAATAQPERVAPLPALSRWALLAGVALLVCYGGAAARLRDAVSATALAAGAGLGFSGLGVAARTIAAPDPWWRLVTDPAAWAICGYGMVAILLFGTALQRGSLTVTSAVTFAVETVVPAAIGLTLLGDRPRPGLAPVAIAGFILTLGGAVLLARYADPAEIPPATTGPASPAPHRPES